MELLTVLKYPAQFICFLLMRNYIEWKTFTMLIGLYVLNVNKKSVESQYAKSKEKPESNDGMSNLVVLICMSLIGITQGILEVLQMCTKAIYYITYNISFIKQFYDYAYQQLENLNYSYLEKKRYIQTMIMEYITKKATSMFMENSMAQKFNMFDNMMNLKDFQPKVQKKDNNELQNIFKKKDINFEESEQMSERKHINLNDSDVLSSISETRCASSKINNKMKLYT